MQLMVVASNHKNALLTKDKQMSRTFRKKIKSNKIIRDGEKQYTISSCRHDSCDYCKNNRTFERFPSFQQEIQLLMEDLTESGSQSVDISSEHIKDIDTLARLWSIKDHHEWMRKRDEILLSRGQNIQTGYTIQGTTQEEIFKELTELQNKVRRQQKLDTQEI